MKWWVCLDWRDGCGVDSPCAVFQKHKPSGCVQAGDAEWLFVEAAQPQDTKERSENSPDAPAQKTQPAICSLWERDGVCAYHVDRMCYERPCVSNRKQQAGA
jgi:hypothetical protein